MSLSSLIQNFITANSSSDPKTKQKLADVKNDPTLKSLSKCVRGGISKMTKSDIEDLKSYKKGVFIVGGKEIIPDDEQMMIINAPYNKNMRIIAGAGTGKTTTITCRIKKLLDNCTTPDKILVLTFNVEARKNLEAMIDKMIGFKIKVDVRTIDSFCYKLKQNFYSDYVMSSAEKDVVNRSLSEYGIVGRKVMEKYGSEVASEYRYVFFDEFQDVDEDQFEILRMLCKNGCHLTVIGDDSQNIYQFRGSDNYYIINFDKIIPNTLTYKITTNYRSTKEIVDLANDSIANNKDKIFKLMKNNTDEKGVIDLTIVNDNDTVIDHIISQIINYVENLDCSYEDIAILSRNTFALKLLETEFEKNKLPYVALISDQFSNDYKQIIQQNKIVLSTIHKAKGLEWKVVFIIGLCDDYFPSHLNNGLKNIEEERRLFYVGTTRSKTYLHFVGGINEVPFSRFIDEIKHRITIINKTNKRATDEVIFSYNEDNKTQDSYSVMKIIEMLNGKKIEKLRELELAPGTPPSMKQIFKESLFFTDAIKKNVFESDYGLYCDYYMIRQLMVINKQTIRDINTEKILLDLHFSEDDLMLYRKHDIKNCILNNQIPKVSSRSEQERVKELIEKMGLAMRISKLPPDSIAYILATGVQNYHYPKAFINNLIKAYSYYTDPTKPNDEHLLSAIYNVSLCPKLNDSRRRLVYRNIHDMYKENPDVLPRIDEYVKMISSNKIRCKIQMSKLFKIDKSTVSLVGELDYLDISNNTLVDIKCSEGEFKIEWLIQLLIYYSLFKCNPHCCEEYDDIDLQKLAIINIFTGKYYEIPIPENYDHKKLLEFVKGMIIDDIKGIREKPQIYPDAELEFMSKEDHDLLTADLESEHMIEIIVDTHENTSGYIVLDVENNTLNMDIIQLAYIVYDDSHNELKRVNSYVKDRFVDERAKQITGITTDTLRQKGIEFVDVIKEFANDLSKVKTICGHHVHTDISKLRSNVEKFKIELVDSERSTVDLFSKTVIEDTIILYRKHNPQAKSMSLQNVYFDLFNEQMIDAHDALSDVVHTAKCYVELKKYELKNSIKKSIVPKSDDSKLYTSRLFAGKTEKIVKQSNPKIESSESDNKTKPKKIVKARARAKPKTEKITEQPIVKKGINTDLDSLISGSYFG